MAKKSLLSPDLLRQLLRYEPDTGVLFWRPRPPEMFSDDNCPADLAARRWNSKCSGKVAGSLNVVLGYRQLSIFGVRLYCHRVIWAMVYEVWPDNIDHINGNRADNRIVNMRDVTRLENRHNSAKGMKNKSGVIGVHLNKKKSNGGAANDT